MAGLTNKDRMMKYKPWLDRIIKAIEEKDYKYDDTLDYAVFFIGGKVEPDKEAATLMVLKEELMKCQGSFAINRYPEKKFEKIHLPDEIYRHCAALHSHKKDLKTITYHIYMR